LAGLQQGTAPPSTPIYAEERDPLWVSEVVITYDGAPSHSVSIMEFFRRLVAHETQYFAGPLRAAPVACSAGRADAGPFPADAGEAPVLI